jgi:hypothetical protein
MKLSAEAPLCLYVRRRPGHAGHRLRLAPAWVAQGGRIRHHSDPNTKGT